MLPASSKTCRNFSPKHVTKTIIKTYSCLKKKEIVNFKQISANQMIFNSLIPRKFNNNRLLSTTNMRSLVQPHWILSGNEVCEFMSYFPEVVRDLTERSPYAAISEFSERFTKVMEYNVPHGKKHRAFLAIEAYKTFESPENLTSENIRLANILGWCIEMSHAAILIDDDIIDGSEIRRGTPCWYRVEGVGMQAINDSQLLECGCRFLLSKHISTHELYVPILELYNDMVMKTRIGQSLDAMCFINGKPQYNIFTIEMLNKIYLYKTTYSAFYLPITLGMYLCGRRYVKTQQELIYSIILELGNFFQTENDVLDGFGDPSKTGKDGNDIKEGKCTWLAVEALRRATNAQRQLLMTNYGKPEPDCQIAVQNLYHELNLLGAYSTNRNNSIKLLESYIRQLNKDAPQTYFSKLLTQLQKNYDKIMLNE